MDRDCCYLHEGSVDIAAAQKRNVFARDFTLEGREQSNHFLWQAEKRRAISGRRQRPREAIAAEGNTPAPGGGAASLDPPGSHAPAGCYSSARRQAPAAAGGAHETGADQGGPGYRRRIVGGSLNEQRLGRRHGSLIRVVNGDVEAGLQELLFDIDMAGLLQRQQPGTHPGHFLPAHAVFGNIDGSTSEMRADDIALRRGSIAVDVDQLLLKLDRAHRRTDIERMAELGVVGVRQISQKTCRPEGRQ